ncbi:uncharacterized protein zbbx isoform X3 [Pseudoliparis swirei]|uniref:uncharacterized protein zbbx isoform X3 n=1 Tax=Pseudoliparis swirei TaxID=2059687 RepID=UPI0024BE3EDD|nr:uncharacterized protein zbbx isoform X3 [Pseudoliparis swirei]
MNLNDFVVLPNNKAKSVKLSARNLQELRMETVTLAQESNEIEEKLQQLKESMSKEKEERGHSGGFRWKSGQFGSLNSNAVTNSVKKNKENTLQKLSAGKVKIRVLKDEPLTAPPRPPPPRDRRKHRLRGTRCGQCEIKTAGVVCAECTEDYCIGCFTRFHQKGALKLHRMIPIQTDLQTHVSTRDVVSCFQEQINPSSDAATFTSHAVAKAMQLPPDPSQVLTEEHGEETKVDMIEHGQNMSFLKGEYNEAESARSFQEALRRWRGEKSDGSGESMSEDAMWTPIQPAVSVMATQADLSPDRGAVGRGGGEERVPVRVEFTENSLTYMDRLLLKKHRRTPVETYHPLLAFGKDLKSLPQANTEEETASSLTAQEEDFRRYCASLFAVPVSSGRPEPWITAPESCLVIEVMDERDKDIHGVVADWRTDNNRNLPSVQPVLIKGALVPHTALTTGSSRVSCSSSSPAKPSRQSGAPAQPKAAQKLHLSKPQTSQAEHSMKSSSSKSKLSSCLTAETPGTSKTSIKTLKPNFPPNVHKSNSDRGSRQVLSTPLLVHSQTETPTCSHSPDSFPPDVSPLASTRPTLPEDHLSPSSTSLSLRSTFTVSPLSSTESTLLPKVYQSTPIQRSSDSSLLREQSQSSKLFHESISLKLSQLPPNHLESPRQYQHSCCVPESPLSDTRLQLPLSPVCSSPNPPPTSLGPNPAVINIANLSLFNASPPDACFGHRSTAINRDSSDFMCSTPISGEHELTLVLQCIPSFPSQFDVIKNLPLAMKMEEERELSVDSGDEMSTDSLGLASYEEDSSDEEAQMHGRLTRGRSRDEQGNPAISHSEDPFVPAEREKHLQGDEQEQLSEPSMAMHNQSAGSRSEQFCDPDGFRPLGLAMKSGHSDTPEHTHCDPLLTGPTSTPYSEPTEGYGPSSSSSTYTEEQLGLGTRRNNRMQPTEILIHSTRPTSRVEISVHERGTSEAGPGFRPFSRAAQEIMEICSVDHTGCEDPDLESDTTTHILEQELMATETWTQASVFGTGVDHHAKDRFTRGRARDEENEEEAATQRDRQSVLSLP